MKLIKAILRQLVCVPTVIIWLFAWRVVMPEHAPLWRLACGWLLVWIGDEIYQWLKRMAAMPNAPELSQPESMTNENQKTEAPTRDAHEGLAPVSLLGADAAAETIREIHAHLIEKHDVGWTELAVLTAKEYAESLHVPQYDLELKLAEAEIKKWQDVARQLYLALGRRKAEKLRVCAEYAYSKAKAPKGQAMPRAVKPE